MEIKYTKNRIEFEKELNSLDKLAIDFTAILDKIGIKYALVSGYVSILFGRNRTSEDIDIIADKTGFPKFKEFWEKLYAGFECVNAPEPNSAYKEYLLRGHAIRFSRKDSFIPNIEFKFPKAELDIWTLKNRKEVILNGQKLFISPLELQIPFKLFLGSEKDIEDARYLYMIFKDKIDTYLMKEFTHKLKVEVLSKRYLL